MSQFSIRDIEHLTGIRAHTLRIWEQRYNVPRPKRTPGNVRYYDDEDLKLLLNIAMLNRNGHKISKICMLSDREIAQLAVDLSSSSENRSVHIHALLAAMLDLDEGAFNKVLSAALLQHGLERTMMEVVFPFMGLIGVMWQTGSLMPPYEHFISAMLRQKLMVAVDGQMAVPRPDAKKFLLFLPQDEHHELGLLFANYIIRTSGHRVLYLGQNLPLNELEQIGDKFLPDYIFTSITAGSPALQIDDFLRELNKKFPSAEILVTGRYFLEADTDSLLAVRKIRHPDDLKSFLV
ncbi:MAG: hypothetical protein RL213_1152 [Bacteroidota bacterium]